MTLFTPALLLFMPFWATAFLLQSSSADHADATCERDPSVPDDPSCPTQWVAMPFTPPPVHAA